MKIDLDEAPSTWLQTVLWALFSGLIFGLAIYFFESHIDRLLRQHAGLLTTIVLAPFIRSAEWLLLGLLLSQHARTPAHSADCLFRCAAAGLIHGWVQQSLPQGCYYPIVLFILSWCTLWGATYMIRHLSLAPYTGSLLGRTLLTALAGGISFALALDNASSPFSFAFAFTLPFLVIYAPAHLMPQH